MTETLARVRSLLQSAQDRKKTYADQRFRRPHEFKEGDLVLLSTKNFKFKKGVKKLHPKYIGPLKIIKMYPHGTSARLEMPSSYSRVHVSLSSKSTMPLLLPSPYPLLPRSTPMERLSMRWKASCLIEYAERVKGNFMNI